MGNTTGFEVRYAGRTLTAALGEKRVITVITGTRYDEAYITFGAMDQDGERFETLEWLEADLLPGEEIEIRVIGEACDSEPYKRGVFTPGRCGIVTDEQKLKYFKTLEKKLEGKGWLPEDE